VYKEALVGYFTARRSELDADSLRRLERNPLRILDSKNPAMTSLIAGAPLLGDYLDDESRRHFDTVQALLGDAGVPFVLNPRLVRGLDYYTRTVFEWVTDRLGSQSAICSGGRYDGLVEQLGGRATPAVGWALGIERVVELMQAEGATPAQSAADVVLITAGEAARRAGFSIAERLRDAAPALRVSVGSPSAGFKAQMRRADKSGAAYAVIVGDEELASGKIGVKPLRRDEPQRSVALEEFAAQLSSEPKRPE
jgi:histidyl-tRNA synthetase